MKIELRLLKDLVPYARNLRKIPQKAIDKVAVSIDKFGAHQPIVVDRDGVIIVGTVRYLACKKLGLENFPVHVAEGLTPEQVQGYRISDNRTNEETDFYLDMVQREIIELDARKFDLKLTAFAPRELDEFLAVATDNDAENSSPAPPTKAVSQPGDLWLCGPHRVLDGDATNPEHVTRVLGDLKPILMISDSPYGVSLFRFGGRRRGSEHRSKHARSPTTTA
jgi:ParB/Sulfiredoxin domain